MENIMNVVEAIPAVIEGAITIITAILVILQVVKSIVQGANKEQVERIIQREVEKAEEDFKDLSGSGEDKYIQVVKKLYGTLPSTVQLVFSLKEVNKMVTTIVDAKNQSGEFTKNPNE